MHRAKPDQIAKPVHIGLIVSTLVLMTSCSTGPDEQNRQHVLELERVSGTDCDEPGGWTNLFFTGDPVAPTGSVALFAEVAPGLPIEVVRRNDDGREIRYSLRIPSRLEEEVLVFTPTRLGRCATAEFRLEGVAHPLRIQISTAEEWVYGRIAEYRAGYFSTEGYRTRVEVHPGSRDAIGLNTVEHVEIYVGSDMTKPVRRFSERLESGEVVFADHVGPAFLIGRTGFGVDSLSTDSRRLYLTEIGDTTLPYRGFVAPEFAGIDLDGNAHWLSGHLGQVVVVEFWSTECAFSELARPQANQLAAALESAGGTYIAMSREPDANMVHVHLEGHPRTSVVLLRDEETWQRWNPETATPLYYVIGSNGRVLMRERGAQAVRLAAAVAGVAIP
jgi:thiol-disulfide isomerase/thioredoxin